MRTIILDGKKKRVTELQRNLIIFSRLAFLFLVFISLLTMCWMVISFFNVVNNNISPESVKNIWDWNFFKVIFNINS